VIRGIRSNNFLFTPKLIEQAYDLIRDEIHETPILTSKSLNEIYGAELFFKCENFQKTGSFKIRGATYSVKSLRSSEKTKGVVTHSSGNHAQALAYAASQSGVTANIVMPENAPAVKSNAVQKYGGLITFCPPTLEDRENYTEKIVALKGSKLIHPYNQPNTIIGQATVAFESFKQLEQLPDILITPVGGGGLLSGSILSVQFFSPRTTIFAAEPAGANDAFRSLQSNELVPSTNPSTICDGLLTSLGEYTWPLIRDYTQEIVQVTDNEVIRSLKEVFQYLKIIIEPSCATVLAAIKKIENQTAGKRVLLILSGGNIEVEKVFNLKPKDHS
jgi:threonine dehydratase